MTNLGLEAGSFLCHLPHLVPPPLHSAPTLVQSLCSVDAEIKVTLF